ncbi:MAG: N-acetylmuramoyl-L-alanine amidase [Sutterella sp.]
MTPALQKQIAAVKAEDPYIAAMRIGQYQPDTVRLVMDLKTDVRPEVFQLKPYANYKYRLVFDIYPAHPVDEVGRLLEGADEKEPEAAPMPDEKDDPLGSMLAGLGRSDKSEKQPSVKNEPPAAASKSPGKGKPPVRSASKKTDGKLIVVVDPGHGGEDPGAIGRRKNQEKTVVLEIGRRLAALINAEPGMRAIMTRKSDHFVSLGARVNIARRAKAHLLVSIHADAWIKSSARGSSVFALSEKGATSATAKWLAQNQNQSDLIGGVNIATVDKQVQPIIADMTKNWTISYSLGLGAAVLREMKTVNRLHKNQVEQAGFAVLKGQGIPSILVETAFISNPEEEKLLVNRRHQQKIAEAILKGIKKQFAANPTLLQS